MYYYTTLTLFNQFASFNNKPFHVFISHDNNDGISSSSSGGMTHFVWQKKYFVLCGIRIYQDIICIWSIIFFLIGICFCVYAVYGLSSVCNVMHLWQVFIFLWIFSRSTRMDYCVCHIIWVKSSRHRKEREDASSDQLLPDITFYVYQFPFIIWIIPICIFYGNTLFFLLCTFEIWNTTR